jgi:hypothetical protein
METGETLSPEWRAEAMLRLNRNVRIANLDNGGGVSDCLVPKHVTVPGTGQIDPTKNHYQKVRICGRDYEAHQAMLVLIRLAACYAHARRKFLEAQEQAPGIIGWILKQIANLYEIEKRLRQKRAGPRLRQAIRAAQSRPIHQRIKQALIRLKTKKRYLPQSSLGKAIDYTLAQWTGLSVFLEDGRVEIDDNLVENAVRPTAVGKRNWLFIGRADAGQRGAILYTIVENCRRQGIDPYTYLRDVLGRLPSLTNQNFQDWTPMAYAKKLRDKQCLAAAS